MEQPFGEKHEKFKGRLSIPYLTRSGVVALRFRGLGEEGAKYLQPAGSKPWLYNVGALYDSPRIVAICEGELDAIVCQTYGHIPAVGIAGVNAWLPSFTRCFESPDRVLIVGDGDPAGLGMTERLCELLEGKAMAAQMPAGHDVNSYYLEHGSEALHSHLTERI